MKVEFLRNKKIQEVKALILGFSPHYATDVRNFAATTTRYGITSPQAEKHLCRLLRKWKACRPSTVRKDLLPILTHLYPDFMTITTVNLRTIRDDLNVRAAITRIWSTLTSQICNNRQISEVATSKAILILTNGRLGPALDSNARGALNLPRIRSSDDYFALLLAISEDIVAFEKVNYPILLEDLIPKEWQPVAVGRAYGMAIGPRGRKTEDIQNLPQQRDVRETPPFTFSEAFRILQLNGPARVISSSNTEYTVEAWTMRDGNPAIRARPRSGYIYIHPDCWTKNITCQGTRAGGIYNGENNIYTWLKNHKS